MLLWAVNDMGHLEFTGGTYDTDIYSIVGKDVIRKIVVVPGYRYGVVTYSTKNNIKRKEYIINGNLITVDFTRLV